MSNSSRSWSCGLRGAALALCFICHPSTMQAEDAPKGATTPAHPGALVGEEARQATQWDAKIDQLLKDKDAAQASVKAKELLSLRQARQGDQHWETVDARWRVQTLELLAAKGEASIAAYVGAQDAAQSATALLSQSKLAEAQPLFQKAVGLYLGVLGEQHPDTATTYLDMADCLNAQGQYAEAQVFYLKALHINLEVLGENHPVTAACYNNAATNLYSQRKSAEAQPLLLQALAIRREVLGEKHPATARSHINLAANLDAQGKYAEAQPLYQKGLDLNLELLGEKHRDTATSYNNLANNLNAQGKYAEAQPLTKKALDLYLELLGEKHPETAHAYSNLGFNLNAQAQYAGAQPLLQKALDLRLALFGEKHPATASSYSNLAANLDSQGRCAEAQPLSEKALAIRLELFGEKTPFAATSYINLATILNAQGKYVEAQALYQKGLELNLELLGEKHPDTARAFSNLAFGLNLQGKFAEAQPLYEKALRLRIELLGEKHPATATSYGNLAENLNGQKKFAEAQVLFQKALDLRLELFGEKHPDTAASYNNLAANLGAQGAHAEAQPLLQKALDLCIESLGEKHPVTAASYINVAGNLAEQGKYVEAAEQLVRAAAAFEAARLNVAARGLDRSVFGAERSPYRMSAAIHARLQSPIAAWVAAETDLARGLSDELASRRGMTLTPDEQQRQAELSAQQSRLQPRILQLVSKQSPSAAEKEERAGLEAERRTVENQLAELAVTLSQRELAPLSVIQSVIPTDVALVLWVDMSREGGVQEHWGCVLRHAGDPIWERLPGTGPPGEKTAWTADDSAVSNRLRAALISGTGTAAEVQALAKALYDQRLAPLTQHLDGVKSLYVVAVNEMAAIPVELLTDQYTISYVPSGTFLARLEDKPMPAGSSLLALGDPVFGRSEQKPSGPESLPPGGLLITAVAPDSAASAARLQPGDVLLWKELPGTRVEVTQIARLFGQDSNTLLDSAASEQALDDMRRSGDLSKYRFVHFATHGEANNVRALESVLVFSQDQLPETPLPRVGEPFINGQLSAKEVLEFWNLNAELVTLSACETALGRQGGGDGLLGFAQAFLTAGSRAVCLSLWKVDDTATALLMSRFYENLLGKRDGLDKPLGKAAALAEAKRWLRELSAEAALKLTASATDGVVRGTRGKGEKLELAIPTADSERPATKDTKPFAHPRYWSAFILIGDPD